MELKRRSPGRSTAIGLLCLNSFLAAIFHAKCLSAVNATVCRTVDALDSLNSSHGDCRVPYRDTELRLSCGISDAQSQEGIVCWTKGSGCQLPNSSSSAICSSQTTYTVNPDGERPLTNDDSGTYCCIHSSKTEFVDVNVLAPPKLIVSGHCSGDNHDVCSNGVRSLTHRAGKLTLTVKFDGNGPFDVVWYHNGTELNCSAHLVIFCSISNDSNSQHLTLYRSSDEDGWLISGNFSASVNNSHGTNTSVTLVEYTCIPSEPQPQIVDKVLHAKEGLPFQSSCSILSSHDKVHFMCAYLTKNVSAATNSLSSLADTCALDDPCCCDLIEGDCAYCNRDKDCFPFNRNITNIVVSRYEDHSDCSPLQIISFKSDSALLSDNGQYIVCAYPQDEFDMKVYSTIQLKVQHNYFLLEIVVPVAAVLGGCMLVIVLLTTRTCVRKRRRKRKHTSSSAHTTIHEEGGHDECEPLMASAGGNSDDEFPPNLEAIEGSLGPVDFPHSLPATPSCSADI